MERFKIYDDTQLRYIQVPKVFLYEEYYRDKLSSDAKLLYGLLLDRMKLSIRNNWVNENNEVYLIMTREEVQEILGLSQPTVTKAFNVLKKMNLIEEERKGIHNPNHIYVGKPTQIQTQKFFGSETKESLPHEPKDFLPTETDITDTEKNRIDSLNQLNKIDIDPDIAVKLVKAYPKRKIKKAVELSEKYAKTNPAGWVIRALEGDYDVINEPDPYPKTKPSKEEQLSEGEKEERLKNYMMAIKEVKESIRSKEV